MDLSTKNIYLGLSGGGFRGIERHIGLYRALDELGIIAKDTYGASAGAITGALHNKGNSGECIEMFVKEKKASDLIQFRWQSIFSSPIYDRTGIYNFLRNKLGATDVVPNMTVAITSKAQRETFYVPATLTTVYASSAIPDVFDLVKIRDMAPYCPPDTYADGGVKDNIPTPRGIDRTKYDLIIISVCNDDDGSVDHKTTRIGRALSWLDDTMDREYHQVVRDWEGFDNVVILKPSPFRSSLLDWSKNYKLIDHAYESDKKILSDKLIKLGWL